MGVGVVVVVRVGLDRGPVVQTEGAAAGAQPRAAEAGARGGGASVLGLQPKQVSTAKRQWRRVCTASAVMRE